jgi:hypothetical protein
MLGTRYISPTSGDRAFVEINNLSPYEIHVALFENPENCSGRNAIHYDSDRDQQNKQEIAGYQDGKPFYYRYARIESAGVGTGRSLRSVPVLARATLMEISVATPSEFRKEPGATTMRYRYCNHVFDFHPLRNERYSFDITTDTTLRQCFMRAFHEVAGAEGRSSRTPLPVRSRKCG